MASILTEIYHMLEYGIYFQPLILHFSRIFHNLTLLSRDSRTTLTTLNRLDFQRQRETLMAMRKFGSILVVMLLLIAYGRCVSDQFGMLHTSEASCCQTICTAVTHCTQPAEACHDHSSSKDETHNNKEKPAPCQLCFILGNDSIMIQDELKIPAPTLSDCIPVFDFGTDLDLLFGRISGLTSADFQLEDLPDPPAELCSLHRCLVTKTSPVRGPSIA